VKNYKFKHTYQMPIPTFIIWNVFIGYWSWNYIYVLYNLGVNTLLVDWIFCLYIFFSFTNGISLLSNPNPATSWFVSTRSYPSRSSTCHSTTDKSTLSCSFLNPKRYAYRKPSTTPHSSAIKALHKFKLLLQER
jgi:hypothetical protein